MIGHVKKSQALFLLILGSALAAPGSAQTAPQYTITTIAGGGPPSGVPSTSVAISAVYAMAIDAGGNVYFTAQQQNTIYRAAPDGTIAPAAGNGTPGFSGDNGPATGAQLSGPTGIAVDSAGNLYIADAGNVRIRKVSGGIITTVAGNGYFGYSGDNGPALSAEFGSINGIAIDSAGSLFVADSSNNSIRKVQNGVITTVAGNGTNGFSGDNGLATGAQLNYPYAVAVDTNGNLYIGDGNNFRIRKVSGGVITTVAGAGVWGFSGDGGPAINAQLSFATGVAVDGAGNLYIADSGNMRIRRVAGGTITTVAGGGGGCAQQTDLVGDGCPAGSASLSQANGVALDGAGSVYIADTFNYRIRKITNGVISTLAGNGSYMYSGDNGLATNAQLSPQSIAVQYPGSFYASDSPDFRVRGVVGGVITTVAGNGSCCDSGDNGPATSAQLGSYSSVAADTVGNLYIAEGTRVRKVSGGVIGPFAGTGTSGYSGDNGPAASAQLSYAVALAVDGAGNVYISDGGNNRVRKVSGGIITTVAGGGPGDGSAATGISVNQPAGVATDAAGNLYLPAAFDNRVYKVSLNGTISTVAGNGSQGFSGDNGPASTAQLNSPYAVAVNSAGTVVYIADRNNNRVRMVSGGVITTVAGGGAGCAQQTDAVGDGCPPASASLLGPSGVAVDPAGATLYIADALNYRIRKVAGGVISTVAGNGACVIISGNGTCSALGDNGPATSAQLNYATGVAVDPTTGDLYIGDSENFRVRRVSGGTITTVAGNGSFGYSGDGGPATSAMLSYSYGIAFDSTGNLYIADAANNRIRKVSGGVISTVAGTGAGGYSGDNVLATTATIANPYGVAVDGTGSLYIADTGNSRIRKVSGGNITTVAGNGFASFSGDGGQANAAQLSLPSAIAVDGAGTLYISDTGNLRVRQVSAGGVIATVAGNGVFGYSGENVPATGSVGNISGLAVDGNGNLFLADQSYSVIQRVSGGSISTIAGNFGYGYSGDGGPATSASLSNPEGLAVDSAGNIYVADYGNSRVRLVTAAPKAIASIAPASVIAGTSNFALQVNGSGFVSGDIVQWNGTNLATTFVNSGRLIVPLVSSGLVSQPATAAITVNGLSNVAGFTVYASPLLTVVKTHSGNFEQGQMGVTYTITVSNTAGLGPTSGTVTVTEVVPFGLSLVSMAGPGWTCPSGGNTCQRSDALAGGTNYPAITVTVNVAANASSLVNGVGVSGGGSPMTSATDPTIVVGAGALRFVPITPCRIADTRNATGPFGGPSISGGTSRDFTIPSSACSIPSTAQAYSLNVAVVPTTTLGYLTLYPAGQSRPLASTLNSLDGRIKSNAAIVPAGTNGAVSVFASDTTHVILDINGYFVPATDPTGLAFYPITPCRITDTRTATAPLGGPALVGGQNRTLPIQSSTCNLPATAQAYSLNFAAVPGGSSLGYLTAWPTGQSRPVAASLNALTGAVTANAAIVPAGTNGSIDVFASNNTNLVIDINGYFAPMGTGGLSLYGVTPCRVLDTRQPSGSPPITSRDVAVSASACGIPATAQADVMSVTVVPQGTPAYLGYLTLWPQGQTRPVVSTLNALDGAITSNLAIVPTTNGSISAFASNATHLIIDISGYFAP